MTGKEIQTSFLRRTGEWKYRMPVVSSSVTLISFEPRWGSNYLAALIVMAGAGYLSGLLMDKIERGDPKRMSKWLRNSTSFKKQG